MKKPLLLTVKVEGATVAKYIVFMVVWNII